MRRLLTVTATTCAALLLAAPVGAGEADDQQIADDVAAQVGELVPDGWEEDPTAGEESDVEQNPPECDEITTTVDETQEEQPFSQVAYQDSADEIGLTEVGTSVYVFPKAKAAKKFTKLLISDDALACAEAAAVLFGNATVEEIEVNNATGFQVNVESQGFAFVIQQLAVRTGRGVLTVTAVSPDAPLPFVEDFAAGLEEALAEAV